MASAKLEAHTSLGAMSEKQLKAAETEATAQAEEGVEEISEEDLEGVDGGGSTDDAGGWYKLIANDGKADRLLLH